MTMFGLRKGSGQVQTNTGVPGGYRNPPGSVMGLLGLSGEAEGRPGQAGGGAPLSILLSLPSLSPTPTLGRGGILLPVGVGLPLGCA